MMLNNTENPTQNSLTILKLVNEVILLKRIFQIINDGNHRMMQKNLLVTLPLNYGDMIKIIVTNDQGSIWPNVGLE